MSHIAKEISELEDEMKVLFNRAVVMLGLCAFRKVRGPVPWGCAVC
jgi:uncharacterized protein with PhoU and TrkA domain